MITSILEFARNINREKLKPLILNDIYTFDEVQLYQSDNYMSANVIFGGKSNQKFIYLIMNLNDIKLIGKPKDSKLDAAIPAKEIIGYDKLKRRKHNEEDLSIVNKLINIIQSGEKLHPIVIDKWNIIMDGSHRFTAYDYLKLEQIPVFKQI